MNDRLMQALRLLPDRLAWHVTLSASALVLACLISLPLAVAAYRSRRLRAPLLGVASVVQTAPSLALVALFYPVLLGFSTLTKDVIGVGFSALGFLPSLLALSLYAMLPLLRNGVAALDGVDPAVIEAADGVGMTRRQRLEMVELPLAAPVIMAGLRTASVWTIGVIPSGVRLQIRERWLRRCSSRSAMWSRSSSSRARRAARATSSGVRCRPVVADSTRVAAAS